MKTAFRYQVTNKLARMVSQYLFGEGGLLADLSEEELIERTATNCKTNMRHNYVNCPLWIDIPELAAAAELELGISFRDRRGKEITFYPEVNFHEIPRKSEEARIKVETKKGKALTGGPNLCTQISEEENIGGRTTSE